MSDEALYNMSTPNFTGRLLNEWTPCDSARRRLRDVGGDFFGAPTPSLLPRGTPLNFDPPPVENWEGTESVGDVAQLSDSFVSANGPVTANEAFRGVAGQAYLDTDRVLGSPPADLDQILGLSVSFPTVNDCVSPAMSFKSEEDHAVPLFQPRPLCGYYPHWNLGSSWNSPSFAHPSPPLYATDISTTTASSPSSVYEAQQPSPPSFSSPGSVASLHHATQFPMTTSPYGSSSSPRDVHTSTSPYGSSSSPRDVHMSTTPAVSRAAGQYEDEEPLCAVTVGPARDSENLASNVRREEENSGSDYGDSNGVRVSKRKTKSSSSWEANGQRGRSQTTKVEEKKPTYATLVYKALMSVPNRRMVLHEIYDYFRNELPYFKNEKGKGWMNSIRHNLSMNGAFIKVERPEGDTGKGCIWALSKEAEVNGIKSTTRYRAKSHARSARRMQATIMPSQWNTRSSRRLRQTAQTAEGQPMPTLHPGARQELGTPPTPPTSPSDSMSPRNLPLLQSPPTPSSLAPLMPVDMTPANSPALIKGEDGFTNSDDWFRYNHSLYPLQPPPQTILVDDGADNWYEVPFNSFNEEYNLIRDANPDLQ